MGIRARFVGKQPLEDTGAGMAKQCTCFTKPNARRLVPNG